MTQPPEIRQAFTELDERLLTLLAKRRALSQQAHANQDAPFSRENTQDHAQLPCLHQKAESLDLPKHLVTQIYRLIWEDEKQLQTQHERHKAD